ncbi:MAG: DUF5330 domain-containing protein [Pseudomonadota bacterium]|nr:DUF5330 domain-containing protein [Pseudomonadota bacterium]
MFLIRTAFWLALLVMLLPTNEEEQRQVYGTAEAAVRDVKTFCVRNPDVCTNGKSALDTFGQKAEFGARMVMDFIKDFTAGQATASADSERPSRIPTMFRRESHGTLTADDLRPGWTGPSSQPGV